MTYDLPILFAAGVSYLVLLFLIAYATDRPRFHPDPVEVAEIIELSISSLMNDTTIKRCQVTLSTGGRVEAPCFDVDGHMVWGATAMILSEFKEILRDCDENC